MGERIAGLATARVVGTGLLGTSIALGLRQHGVRVLLADPSPTALALAEDVGGGEPDPGGIAVDLVVVAAPPDVTADVVLTELETHPDATVTDVASVKAGIAAAVAGAAGAAGAARYVGGHPMAGRERSGPVAAQADLFLGRPWVLCPSALTDDGRLALVRRVVVALGAAPVQLDAAAHDEAVALVSHVPQVAASLVSARLVKAADEAVALAGQGLRDTTRIADSDPSLWAQILAANSGPVVRTLKDLRADLDDVIGALESASRAQATVARVVESGRDGRARIPGKHGGSPTRYAQVTVLLPDRPGQLRRLFDDIGEAGINVEEFALEHAAGQLVGLAEVSVLPAARPALVEALTARDWRVVS
ncbi:prephenate dehydrogenase [Spongisporangium articulatum]|uniref:Prephenate dehydrogenase n=1 Tax=Spongisporangium articulatum TaxID=3362603 RepID=A0ABW8AUP5_9ACTN